MPTRTHEDWMRRALDLARRGEAQTSPNPMVGAVLVKNGRVVGEGCYKYDGVKHAEILALERAGAAARGATLYINLEPCSHTGRTGPCTAAILAAGVPRVVAAMTDPNPLVSGRGFRQLRRAGVQVDVGLFARGARRMNESFAKWIRTRRPLVTLKSALTLDGFIASPPGKSRGGSVTWITSPASRAEVQRMRHAADALVTGIGTVLADNPRLSERTGLPRRRPLLRVVLDSRLRLPLNSKLAKSTQQDLLVFTAAAENSSRAKALRRAGVEVVRIKSSGPALDLRAVVDELGCRQMTNVLLEAGGRLNAAALASGIVDKLVLFFAPMFLGKGVPVAAGKLGPLHWRDIMVARCGPDIVLEGYLRDVYGSH